MLYWLWQQGKYTNLQIGELFGLTYSSVSRRVTIIREKMALEKNFQSQVVSFKSQIKPWPHYFYTKEETKQAEALQSSINQINAIYPDGSSIPLILKGYLARKGIIANPMSNTQFKGDTDRIISLLESKIRELEQKGHMPLWDLNIENLKVLTIRQSRLLKQLTDPFPRITTFCKYLLSH